MHKLHKTFSALAECWQLLFGTNHLVCLGCLTDFLANLKESFFLRFLLKSNCMMVNLILPKTRHTFQNLYYIYNVGQSVVRSLPLNAGTNEGVHSFR